MVHVVDDDPSALRSMERLMSAHGFKTKVFASASEMLACDLPDANACLLIDVAMPEMNGLALHAELLRSGCRAPAIFITALDDHAAREAALAAGAAGFFRKPADGDELLAAIRRATAQRGEPGGASLLT